MSVNPVVNLSRRFCSFGEVVARTRLCVSLSWNRPALQYIMNCLAQVKVMLPSASALSIAWPIREEIWVLLTVKVEGNH